MDQIPLVRIESATPPFQFRLGSLFRWMTILASAAAIFAWIKPYFDIGVDPPLLALPFLALAIGVFVLATLWRSGSKR